MGHTPVEGRGGMRIGVARAERLAPSDIADEFGDGDSGSSCFSRREPASNGGLLRNNGIWDHPSQSPFHFRSNF